MSKSIAICADTGFGKSTSIAPILELNHIGLDPKETLIINVKGKPLPFRGWEKDYLSIKTKDDLSTKNYLATTDFQKIVDVLEFFDKNRPEIKNVIVDDFQYLMADSFMKDALKTGYDKFNKLAKLTYDVLNAGLNMREDVNFIVLTHSELITNEEFGSHYKMKTIGAMLDSKINLEGLFTIVLYGKSYYDSKSGKSDKKFVTNFDGQYPAKTPLGMFKETYVPNDLGYILQEMNTYYKG